MAGSKFDQFQRVRCPAERAGKLDYSSASGASFGGHRLGGMILARAESNCAKVKGLARSAALERTNLRDTELIIEDMPVMKINLSASPGLYESNCSYICWPSIMGMRTSHTTAAY